jgi:hypothetical protein
MMDPLHRKAFQNPTVSWQSIVDQFHAIRRIMPPGAPKSRPVLITVTIGKTFTLPPSTTALDARLAMEDAIVHFSGFGLRAILGEQELLPSHVRPTSEQT